ncbi:MAG TPA: MoaD/ThiS family protein [Dehalococcoidia bacterium]|nr:MoaD/ThiS family protein [Dehalococcoidia bacterium]
MPEVILTRALSAQTGGALRHQVRANHVREALDRVFDDCPLLHRYLLTDTGKLRPHVNIFVNGAMIADRRELTDPLTAQDEVHVLQAVSSGVLPDRIPTPARREARAEPS